MKSFGPHLHAGNFRLALLSGVALASLALATAAACASEGGRVASEHGCLNCHTPQARSAPSLDQLVEKMTRKGDAAEALQHRLREVREKTAIHSHQMVSDESALAVLRWFAQGAE